VYASEWGQASLDGSLFISPKWVVFRGFVREQARLRRIGGYLRAVIEL
jgi:hypothetical protein